MWTRLRACSGATRDCLKRDSEILLMAARLLEGEESFSPTSNFDLGGFQVHGLDRLKLLSGSPAHEQFRQVVSQVFSWIFVGSNSRAESLPEEIRAPAGVVVSIDQSRALADLVTDFDDGV
ncbi:MAG: hypothetical protein ACI91F_000081 [Candidatus Binatia bacterium]|jgi:hypothetical protein